MADIKKIKVNNVNYSIVDQVVRDSVEEQNEVIELIQDDVELLKEQAAEWQSWFANLVNVEVTPK